MIRDTGNTYLYGEIPKPKVEITPQVESSQDHLYGELLDKATTTLNGDPVSQSFLYGEVCARAEKANYRGSTTASAETVVEGSTISVNVDQSYIRRETNLAVASLNLGQIINTKVGEETQRAELAESTLQSNIEELKPSTLSGCQSKTFTTSDSEITSTTLTAGSETNNAFLVVCSGPSDRSALWIVRWTSEAGGYIVPVYKGNDINLSFLSDYNLYINAPAGSVGEVNVMQIALK